MTFITGLTIGARIDQGYFGEVFLGQDRIHGLVAVKLMRKDYPDPETDAEWNARKAGLLSEAQLLKKSRHAHVIDVFHFDSNADGLSVIYVMHLADGGSLQALYEQRPMTLGDVRDAATGAALGLSAMHARGMLHRDIKPSNLLSDAGSIKLGDFGLVTDQLIMGFGSVAGYNDHLAPEVFARHPTSVQSDVWALGMTIVRLLLGKALFEEMPAPASVVPLGGYADRISWLPHIPKRWRRVVRQMLRDDPSERIVTAQAVQNALATLPVPDWTVDVKRTMITWRKLKGSRAVIVLWDFARPKAQTWQA